MQNYKFTDFIMEKSSSLAVKKRIFLVLAIIYSGLGTLLAQEKSSEELVPATIKTICIDAGHGGKDPGCLGSSSNEKTVCLNMALKLGKKIATAYPDIKIVYTRDKDVFVELDDRAKIANKNKADLFICIHANSASPAAYGAETYVLGLHRTDAQQKIAERENSTIYLEEDKGEKYKGYDLSPDALIARQFQLATFLNHSILFASKLQAEFKAIGRHDRGVKQAGFLVLYKTTMPSVLIETGFLTNPNEEAFLRDTASQSKMAEAMFQAFKKYKVQLEGVDSQKSKSTTDPGTVSTGVSSPATTTNSNQASPKASEPSANPFKGTSEEGKEQLEKVVFRVQVETSTTRLALTSARFKGQTVFEYIQDKIYKYTVGEFSEDFEAANQYKNEMRNLGFSNAFVVAFKGDVRLALDQALQQVKK